MTETRRAAPDPEFVMLYRRGMSSLKIAAATGAAGSTVRYHLLVAVRQDPGIRDEHNAALVAAPRMRPAGQRNVADILAFHATHGRLPGTQANTARERALGMWLRRRRREAIEGTLAPVYRDALAVIPDWDQPSTRAADDAARWQHRLDQIRSIRAAGGQWPRHQKTDDTAERTLGVWLHQQRIDYRAGRMTTAKQEQLDQRIPGWREGRPRGGGRQASPPT